MNPARIRDPEFRQQQTSKKKISLQSRDQSRGCGFLLHGLSMAVFQAQKQVSSKAPSASDSWGGWGLPTGECIRARSSHLNLFFSICAGLKSFSCVRLPHKKSETPYSDNLSLLHLLQYVVHLFFRTFNDTPSVTRSIFSSRSHCRGVPGR